MLPSTHLTEGLNLRNNIYAYPARGEGVGGDLDLVLSMSRCVCLRVKSMGTFFCLK